MDTKSITELEFILENKHTLCEKYQDNLIAMIMYHVKSRNYRILSPENNKVLLENSYNYEENGATVSFDLTSKEKGQFAEEIKNIIDEIKNDNTVHLCKNNLINALVDALIYRERLYLLRLPKIDDLLISDFYVQNVNSHNSFDIFNDLNTGNNSSLKEQKLLDYGESLDGHVYYSQRFVGEKYQYLNMILESFGAKLYCELICYFKNLFIGTNLPIEVKNSANKYISQELECVLELAKELRLDLIANAQIEYRKIDSAKIKPNYDKYLDTTDVNFAHKVISAVHTSKTFCDQIFIKQIFDEIKIKNAVKKYNRKIGRK